MSRIYVVHDARGERQLDEHALPLSIGGVAIADIVMPAVSADRLLAYVALADGHAYIQAASEDLRVFHNQQQLRESHWLKSGDEVQFEDAVLTWTVQGDLVVIRTLTRPLSASVSTTAGATPPLPTQVATAQALPVLPAPVPARQSSRKWRWALFMVFVCLLLTSAFVLLATPVAVHVTPEPASQTLHGFPPPVSLGDRRLALPGRYTVMASRAGYRDLQAEIDVERGGLQTFKFQLEELPGRVSFQLQPAVPYRVFVDGAPVLTDDDGVTEIVSGVHQVRIETARYLPFDAQLDIAGRGAAQQFDVSLQPGWANVRIDSEPAGASVQIDGELVGVTPLALEVMAGERHVEAALLHYKTVTLLQAFAAGSEVQLDDIVLQPADGQLIVNSEPAGATISVAGVFYGSTPATLSLASGEPHTVRLNKPGYHQTDSPVTLAADETQQLVVTLSPQYGVVFVTARPADANLAIDGKAVGAATRRLRLTTRPHTLSFSKPGFASQQVSVTPRTGISKRIDVSLNAVTQSKTDTQTDVRPPLRTAAGGQQLRLVVPAGNFRMGASRREAGRRANESPRLVQLTRPFYLAEKEVTNADFRRFRAAHDSGRAEGMSLNADAQPVVNVSWDDAARYCNWLSKQDGLPPAYREHNGRMSPVTPMSRGYRMPTEAEWAYVARKLGRQDAARYPWTGKYPPVQSVGNFADASIADTLANTVPDYNDGHRVAAPVGSYSAQSGGFYDLGGNVAEWTNDYYAVYPGMAETLVTDPVGPASGGHHVVRGSGWRHGGIAELRLSYRDYSREPRPDLGFRVARYAE